MERAMKRVEATTWFPWDYLIVTFGVAWLWAVGVTGLFGGRRLAKGG